MFNPLNRRGFISRFTQMILAASVTARLELDFSSPALADFATATIKQEAGKWTTMPLKDFCNHLARTYGGKTDEELTDWERDEDDFDDTKVYGHNY